MYLKIKDLIGKTYSRLTILESSGIDKGGHRLVRCKCSCGKEKIVRISHIVNNEIMSCGCLEKENQKYGSITHGLARTMIYRIWAGMIQRCYNHNEKIYKYYGGRGIRVCDKWKNSFSDFFLDVGSPPTKNHSLDRFPDKDGNYEPGNVRWATKIEQSRNLCNNVYLEYDGIKLLQCEWASIFGVNAGNIIYHLRKKSFCEIYLFYKNKNKFNEKDFRDTYHGSSGRNDERENAALAT